MIRSYFFLGFGWRCHSCLFVCSRIADLWKYLRRKLEVMSFCCVLGCLLLYIHRVSHLFFVLILVIHLFAHVIFFTEASSVHVTMKNSKPTSLPPGIRDPSRRHLTHPTIRDKITIEKYSHETNGEYTLIRCTVSPGGGTPLHYHLTYREELTPVSGALGYVLDDDTLHASPGETAIIPINTKHRFFNDTDADVEFLGKLVPGHEGFEKSLYVIYGLAEDGECDEKGLPKSFVHLCLMAQLGDMKWPGLMSWVGNGAVRAIAAYAR